MPDVRHNADRAVGRLRARAAQAQARRHPPSGVRDARADQNSTLDIRGAASGAGRGSGKPCIPAPSNGRGSARPSTTTLTRALAATRALPPDLTTTRSGRSSPDAIRTPAASGPSAQALNARDLQLTRADRGNVGMSNRRLAPPVGRLMDSHTSGMDHRCRTTTSPAPAMAEDTGRPPIEPSATSIKSAAGSSSWRWPPPRTRRSSR